MTTPSKELNQATLELAKTFNVPAEIYKCSDYQKMVSGMSYNALNPLLVDARTIAHERADAYSDMRLRGYDSPAAYDSAREEAIAQLFGHTGKPGRIEGPLKIDYGYNISIGDNFYANFRLCLLDCAPIKIGDNVMCGPNVTICTAAHPLNAKERISGIEFAHPIVIGDNVWLGANAVILPGVTVGNNSVVAAGAVVSRDVPPNVVVAGVPAKKIRDIDNTNLELEEPALD